MYRRLESAEITGTALALSDRISARFPGSGLSRVAKELVGVCQDAAQTATWLARPRKLLRAGVAVGLMVIFVALLGTVLGVRVRMAFTTFSEFVQGLQAGIQNLVFLGIAVLFLLGLERRWKRRRAVSALHSLRSIAHIIDMHSARQGSRDVGFRRVRRGSSRGTRPDSLSGFLQRSAGRHQQGRRAPRSGLRRLGVARRGQRARRPDRRALAQDLAEDHDSRPDRKFLRVASRCADRRRSRVREAVGPWLRFGGSGSRRARIC